MKKDIDLTGSVSNNNFIHLPSFPNPNLNWFLLVWSLQCCRPKVFHVQSKLGWVFIFSHFSGLSQKFFFSLCQILVNVNPCFNIVLYWFNDLWNFYRPRVESSLVEFLFLSVRSESNDDRFGCFSCVLAGSFTSESFNPNTSKVDWFIPCGRNNFYLYFMNWW